MLYSIKNGDNFGNFRVNLSKSQVKELPLQNKMGKQNLHENIEKIFGPVTDIIKSTSQDLTKTMMLTSKGNNKALENLNNKLLETMNDKCIKAYYLLSPLSKITNPDHTSQFKLLKDPSSNRVKDLIKNKSTAVTLYNTWLTFRDIDKEFELKGDLLKTITNRNFNVDLANLPDNKLS